MIVSGDGRRGMVYYMDLLCLHNQMHTYVGWDISLALACLAFHTLRTALIGSGITKSRMCFIGASTDCCSPYSYLWILADNTSESECHIYHGLFTRCRVISMAHASIGPPWGLPHRHGPSPARTSHIPWCVKLINLIRHARLHYTVAPTKHPSHLTRHHCSLFSTNFYQVSIHIINSMDSSQYQHMCIS